MHPIAVIGMQQHQKSPERLLNAVPRAVIFAEARTVQVHASWQPCLIKHDRSFTKKGCLQLTSAAFPFSVAYDRVYAESSLHNRAKVTQ